MHLLLLPLTLFALLSQTLRGLTCNTATCLGRTGIACCDINYNCPTTKSNCYYCGASSYCSSSAIISSTSSSAGGSAVAIAFGIAGVIIFVLCICACVAHMRARRRKLEAKNAAMKLSYWNAAFGTQPVHMYGQPGMQAVNTTQPPLTDISQQNYPYPPAPAYPPAPGYPQAYVPAAGYPAGPPAYGGPVFEAEAPFYGGPQQQVYAPGYPPNENPYGPPPMQGPYPY